MKTEGKTQAIGTVHKQLKDKFEAYCEQVGFIKSRAIEGALLMFMKLPTEEQLKLIKESKVEQ